MHHTEHDKEYGIAMKKVLEYIQLHLSGDLRLEVLAGVANYSPFHFQRLFSEQMGESPKQYIIRLRLERTAHLLKIFPKLSISELSLESGFASHATFSRAFKDHFGITAEEFKKLPPMQSRKICKTDRKKSKTQLWDPNDLYPRDFSAEEIMEWTQKANVEISQRQCAKIIYNSTTLQDPNAISLAFRELCRWAGPRGLLTANTRYTGILLDIPFITPLEKCRYRAGITIADHLPVPSGASLTEIPAGIYAGYSMKGNLLSVVKSLVYFSHGWLPESGMAIKSINGFELFSENPADKPSESILREILIPVQHA
jgi:AraC family transcriptional regulator